MISIISNQKKGENMEVILVIAAAAWIYTTYIQ